MLHTSPLITINKLVFYASLLLLPFSCMQRNHFPDDVAVAPELLQPPAQRPADAAPFTASHNDANSKIKPLPAY